MERTCIAITSSDKDAVMHLEIYDKIQKMLSNSIAEMNLAK